MYGVMGSEPTSSGEDGEGLCMKLAVPTSEVNTPLLRKALEYITSNRKEWDQSCYLRETECRTVGCLAGHMVLLSGVEYNRGAEFVDLAVSLSGLSSTQALMLFSPTNTLLDLWELASIFTDGAIEVPPEVKT